MELCFFIINWYLLKRINQHNFSIPLYTGQKMKFSIKDFFTKYEQIDRKLQIWPHLLKKSLMENFIFCAVVKGSNICIIQRRIYDPIELFHKNSYQFLVFHHFCVKAPSQISGRVLNALLLSTYNCPFSFVIFSEVEERYNFQWTVPL